jgi:hypothetical protein
MTETEWLTCVEPRAILFLRAARLSDRKKRLYLVACCRSIWSCIKVEKSKEAVSVAERFADGLASESELREAYEAAVTISNAPWNFVYSHPGIPQSGLIMRVGNALVAATNSVSPEWAFNAGPNAAYAVVDADQELAKQAHLLRDIFGNPFRPVTFDPKWRTTTALALAQGIYDERAFDRLPILADALQDAGCDNDDILTHLRDTTTPHVRGCWALDLVLGKE